MPRLRTALVLAQLIPAIACGCSSVRAPAAAPAAMHAAMHAALTTLDDAQLREESTALRRFDAGGTIRRVEWSDDGRTLSFERLGEACAFDLVGRVMVPAAEEDDEDDDDGRRRDRGPARGRQRAKETSPDGAWTAISRDWNVFIESEEGEETIEVTTDGHRKLRYGVASWVYGEELDQQSAMWWSPDSRYLAFYAFDEHDVPDYYLLRGLTDLHTTPEQEGYPKPGQPNPTASLLVFDMESGETRPIDTSGDGSAPEPWYVYNVRFTPGGDELLFHQTSRHQDLLRVRAADVATGAVRTVVTERQETWQENRPLLQFLDDGERFIWASERSGFEQYELRHLDGRLLNPLTHGSAAVTDVVRIDEEAGLLYYTAYDPDAALDVHLHRVRLDGTDQRRLTRAPGHHTVRFSPDGAWFITQHEAIDRPPTTVLHSADGTRVATLAQSEPERVETLGYPPAELFTFEADDGTELYGWLHRPRGFDPARKYPLLIDVYGGPGSKGVHNRFRPGHVAAAMGFLVAKIDNRGTGGRGKDFLGAGYLKLGIVDIQDQADGVRHLAGRPYVDADRVGIYGHSYGGYLAALAILKYPDVFHVAVAGAPVTDWRNYDTIYTERYMRTPEENAEGYDAGSCLTYAADLRGRLLIQHGMVDDNVHPNNAWQLVDALQKAGKPFDMMFYPNSAHGLGGKSGELRWRYLYENLIAPPDRSGRALAGLSRPVTGSEAAIEPGTDRRTD